MGSETKPTSLHAEVSTSTCLISKAKRAWYRTHPPQEASLVPDTIYPLSRGAAKPLAGHSYSRVRRSQTQKKQLQCFLLKLPVELIQWIAALLPPSSAAVFSITGRALRYIVGLRYLTGLLDDGMKNEQILFLSIMGQKVPYCVSIERDINCQHSATTRPQAEVTLTIPCINRHLYVPFEDYCTSLLDGIREYYHWPRRTHQFTFKRHSVQLCIELHRCGVPEAEALSGFRYSDEKLGISVEPQIVNHELILKEVYSLRWPKLLPRLAYSRFDWNFATRQDAPQFSARACPHVEDVFMAPLKDSFIDHDFQDAYTWPGYTLDYQTNIESCLYCCTDYRIWYKAETGKLEIHIWKNLGDGRFPPERKWLSQLATGWRYEATESRIDYKHGSVSEAFESSMRRKSEESHAPQAKTRSGSGLDGASHKMAASRGVDHR